MTNQKVLEVSVSYSDSAAARIQEIHAMRGVIPQPEMPAAPVKGLGAASVPPEFIELTANARTLTPELVHGAAVPPEKLRELMAFATAYDPLAEELEALARFIRQRTAQAKNVAGSEALMTYNIARRLASRPATAYLATQVTTMRRALGGRFVRKRKAEQPVPAPVPPVATEK